jgi:hypothetical protein
MEALGKIFAGILVIALSVIIAGFFLMKLWGWFVIPVFPTLPVLTLQQAIGLSVFFTLIRAKKPKDEKEKDFGDIILEWLEGLIFSLILFGIAYVIYLFIQ